MHSETSVVNLIFYLLYTPSSRIQKCSLFSKKPFPKSFGACITLSVVLNHRICILRFRIPTSDAPAAEGHTPEDDHGVREEATSSRPAHTSPLVTISVASAMKQSARIASVANGIFSESTIDSTAHAKTSR